MSKLSFSPAHQLDWVEVSGTRVPLFYSADTSIFEPFLMYALHIAYKKKDQSTQARVTALNNVAYHLLALMHWLTKCNLKWTEVDDNNLQQFKYWQEKRIASKKSSRDEKSARRTTNLYLKTIYHFYAWAQHDVELCSGIIGWPKFPIKSTLPNKLKGKTKVRITKDTLFPILFRNVGENSRHKYQYEATNADIDKLTEYFYLNFSVEVAERNTLIMLIANGVGWRQGSINSLIIDQFSNELLESGNAIFVTPIIQKFGYQNGFEVNFSISSQINRYIHESRTELLIKLGVTEKQACNRLFLNTKTGKPLSRKTITDIFAKAFTAIGAPKGAGIHSFRSKYTNDEVNIELAVRSRESRNTDPVNIGFSMSKKLGHSSMESQAAYSKVVSKMTWRSVERQQNERIKALEHEISNLQKKLAESLSRS